MSEHLPRDEEQSGRARRLAAEAAQTWIDQFEGFEGSIVTGYVLIAETTQPGSVPIVQWMTGDGAAPSDGTQDGIAPHRAMGLIEYVRNEIHRTVGE